MRAIVPVLAVSLSLVLPFAAADESHSDCEEEQPWIGYRTSDPVRALAAPMIEDAGVFASACEGEQWDGQDSIAGRDTVAYRLGEDPNTMASDDPLDPVGARATLRDENEAYLALNLALVGRAAIYVGTCGAGEAGLEGEASCRGTRELRSGVYVRDNTPGNGPTNLLRCLLSVAGCYVSESDCSQEIYQQGAYNPPSQCQRDNTAFGAMLVLP